MEKLHTSKAFLKMAGDRRHTPHPTPMDPPLAISYKSHPKSLAYFSHLAPLILFLFNKKQSQKERTRGGWHNVPLNTLLTALHIFRDMILIGKKSTIVFSAIDKLVAFMRGFMRGAGGPGPP